MEESFFPIPFPHCPSQFMAKPWKRHGNVMETSWRRHQKPCDQQYNQITSEFYICRPPIHYSQFTIHYKW
jgi:hypothetical protein